MDNTLSLVTINPRSPLFGNLENRSTGVFRIFKDSELGYSRQTYCVIKVAEKGKKIIIIQCITRPYAAYEVHSILQVGI